MKLFFLLTFSILILSGCGKKAEPEYKVTINKKTFIIV